MTMSVAFLRPPESRHHRYQNVNAGGRKSCEFTNKSAARSKFVKQADARMRSRETTGRLRLMDIHRKTRAPVETNQTAQRRLFVAVQASKAALGAALSVAFVFLVGRPDVAEAVAIAGLVAPAILALLAYTPVSLEILE